MKVLLSVPLNISHVIANLIFKQSLLLLLFSRSVLSNSLKPHGLLHASLPCPSPSPGACSNSCPLSQWQAPPSMGFSRQEYWSGLPLPSLQHIWPKLFTTFSLGLHVSYFCLMKHLLTLRKEKLGEKEKGDVIKGHNFPQLWTIYI